MSETASGGPSDPLDSDDPVLLRGEILRLRDAALGEQARNELLTDRIATLEGELHAVGDKLHKLDAHTQSLQRALQRTLSYQARRVLGRIRRSIRTT